jgi:hypothetical protein
MKAKSIPAMDRTSQQFNSGMSIINPLDSKPDEATLVVTGPARSGTTMVTQLLIHLGYIMGTELDTNLLEDIPMRHAIRDRDERKMKRLIKERNRLYPVWGWKYPATMEYLKLFKDELRNPLFLFCFRDPVATATRNQMAGAADVLANMEDALNYMREALVFSRENGFPCLFISYEKAILYPEQLVNLMLQFLHQSVSETQFHELKETISLNNTRYKLAGEAENFRGVIDHISWSQVGGWALRKDKDGPADLELWVDLKCVKRFSAGVYRADLDRQGIGDGRHGFLLDIASYLPPGTSHRVEVKHADVGFPLIKSPVFVHAEG